MALISYDRQKAVEYAEKWALGRNPKYLSYSGIGGDCTNFVSQCLYAGCGVMNYAGTYGWYYRNGNDKAPSWTGVRYLYNFLTTNKVLGPLGVETTMDNVEIGDIAQLGSNNGDFYHSLFITRIDGTPTLDTISVTTHSFDSLNRPLSSYIVEAIRFIHIKNVIK